MYSPTCTVLHPTHDHGHHIIIAIPAITRTIINDSCYQGCYYGRGPGSLLSQFNYFNENNVTNQYLQSVSHKCSRANLLGSIVTIFAPFTLPFLINSDPNYIYHNLCSEGEMNR